MEACRAMGKDGCRNVAPAWSQCGSCAHTKAGSRRPALFRSKPRVAGRALQHGRNPAGTEGACEFASKGVTRRREPIVTGTARAPTTNACLRQSGSPISWVTLFRRSLPGHSREPPCSPRPAPLRRDVDDRLRNTKARGHAPGLRFFAARRARSPAHRRNGVPYPVSSMYPRPTLRPDASARIAPSQ